MKIVSINASSGGNIGEIVSGIQEEALKKGMEYYIAYPKAKSNKKISESIIIGNRFERNLHRVLYYLSGYGECFSIISTIIFCKKMDNIKPNILHFHNLHSNFINIKILSHWVVKNKVKVVYTFHDCWPMTGRCVHFQIYGCSKWKMECNKCPTLHLYPQTMRDQSKFLYHFKKNYLGGLDNLTITTPSLWLANVVRKSFYKDKPIYVINNYIDTRKIRKINSNIRKKMNIEGKYVLLGVAGNFNYAKGFDLFLKLAKILDESFQIVLVGNLDKSMYTDLPSNVKSLGLISDKNKLCEIYTMTDIFINLTREEVFGLVNIEALACGTPVITSNAGGSPECIDETCGKVIDVGDLDALFKAINEIRLNPISENSCIARSKLFSREKIISQYLDMYEGIVYESIN